MCSHVPPQSKFSNASGESFLKRSDDVLFLRPKHIYFTFPKFVILLYFKNNTANSCMPSLSLPYVYIVGDTYLSFRIQLKNKLPKAILKCVCVRVSIQALLFLPPLCIQISIISSITYFLVYFSMFLFLNSWQQGLSYSSWQHRDLGQCMAHSQFSEALLKLIN